MRPLKFRAWDIDHKEFVYFDFSDLESMESFWGRHQLAENSVFEYQQYTGLKDNNGVEIYEGDILQTICKNGNRGYPRLVEYMGILYTNIWSNNNIIGNIYENPELLEANL